MMESIRLGPHKGYEGGELTGLGHINVICGRNDSGKSTLLEAIASDSHLRVTKQFTEPLWKDVFAAGCGMNVDEPQTNPGWPDRGRVNAFRGFCELVAGYSHLHPDDLTALRLHLLENGALNLVRGHRFDLDWIVNRTRELIGDTTPPARVLIPAKRRIATTQDVVGVEGVSADGTGLLLNLLYGSKAVPGKPDTEHYRQLSERFFELTGGYSFDVNLIDRQFRSGLHFRRPNGLARPASEFGLGLQDLLIILHFCLDPQFSLLLIEEPENHLHAALQRRLIGFMASLTDKQFVLSSHSNVFLDGTLVDRIFYTECDEKVTVSDVGRKSDVLTALGYSVAENLCADAIILTEGSTDVPVLREFLKQMGVIPRFEVRFWPLGGDAMQSVDLGAVLQGPAVLAIVDKDPESRRARNRFKAKCQEFRVPFHKLERRAIENYFTVDAIRNVNKTWVPDGLLELDHNARVQEQLNGNDIKKNNDKIARRMTIDDIRGTDLFDFLEGVRTACSRRQ